MKGAIMSDETKTMASNNVPINVGSLLALRDHARRVGTLDEWSDLAIKWARGADEKISHLNFELRKSHEDLSGAYDQLSKSFEEIDRLKEQLRKAGVVLEGVDSFGDDLLL